MLMSASIKELAAALAKAQGEIEAAAKNKRNSHFGSLYADLASVQDACRAPLARHGIAVVQSPSAEGTRVTVTTLLAHSSGEWISGELSVAARDAGPQAAGSAITYARRYGLAALVGVAPDDDDGHAAESATRVPPRNGGPPTQTTDATGLVTQTAPRILSPQESAAFSPPDPESGDHPPDEIEVAIKLDEARGLGDVAALAADVKQYAGERREHWLRRRYAAAYRREEQRVAQEAGRAT